MCLRPAMPAVRALTLLVSTGGGLCCPPHPAEMTISHGQVHGSAMWFGITRCDPPFFLAHKESVQTGHAREQNMDGETCCGSSLERKAHQHWTAFWSRP